MIVRAVARAEAARLRALRLRALEHDPDGFGATLAEERARPDAWWDDWARASEKGREQRTFAVVGEEDDDGTGFLGLALVRVDDEAAGIAGLYAMWLDPAARGRGMAGALCDACAEWASARGCRVLRLSVFAPNVVARRAYAAAGFVPYDRADIVTRDGRALDELRLERRLRGGADVGGSAARR